MAGVRMEPPGHRGGGWAWGQKMEQLKTGRTKSYAWVIKFTNYNQFKEDHVSKKELAIHPHAVLPVSEAMTTDLGCSWATFWPLHLGRGERGL